MERSEQEHERLSPAMMMTSDSLETTQEVDNFLGMVWNVNALEWKYNRVIWRSITTRKDVPPNSVPGDKQ